MIADEPAATPSREPAAPRLVSVAVPVPLLNPLHYSVPDPLPTPSVGARVRVPLGPRIVTGCVVEVGAEPIESTPKALIEVLDEDALVPPAVVGLCRWVAEYYVAGIGDALAAAMPPGAQRTRSSFKHQRVVSLATGATEAARLTPGQRAAVEALRAFPAGTPIAELRARGIAVATLTRLARNGVVAIEHQRVERDPFLYDASGDPAREHGRALTAEQLSALGTLSAMLEARQFGVALLQGVTGSGKTEVYLRLAEQACRTGGRVLVLVPEIGLTPSMAAHFRTLFGSRVAIQHSALSEGARHDQWYRIRRGEIDVVVGTRSAVFAPLERIALVIVDEEHDASYKQEETPRYHGRDVAIVRAQRDGALVVLGSATPSMETCHNAMTGKYSRVVLSRRVLDRPLANVNVVDMRVEYAEVGPDVVISRPLAAAVEARLQKGEQALVLLNRRGYATAIVCRQCADTFDCPNCSVSLTVHAAGNGWRARCHYCGYGVKVPSACRRCAAPYLEHTGIGTERVEADLRERFPSARIARLDRDTVRRQGALNRLLTSFGKGEVDVLVGTQMIAKGHDFPRVTLVGVVSADVGLGLADFRASERTFQLLTQVAGRAGRGGLEGEAIVQTLYPNHYSIQCACRQDYWAFFDREIVFRRQMRYPPFVALVNGLVRGRTFDAAMRTAREIVGRLEPAAARGAFEILGPAPAPMGRLRGQHRVQFFLKGMKRSALRAAMVQAMDDAPPEVRRQLIVDVDPLSLL